MYLGLAFCKIGAMNLSELVSNMSRRNRLAQSVGVVPAYLWQIATDRRKASPKLAIAIEQATQGAVTKESLRPDVWQEHENK